MKEWIQAVWEVNGTTEPLRPGVMAAAAHAMATGKASDAQCAAFLTGMRMKGESKEELLAFIEAFSLYRQPIVSQPASLSSGGERPLLRLFPVSLAVALLLGSAGFQQCLLGHAYQGGQGGIAELLRRLRIRTRLSPHSLSAIWMRTRMGYFEPAVVCPPLGRLRHVRRQLGIPSLLEEVELALNPVGSKLLLLGVGDGSASDRWAELIPLLGYQLACLVEGIGGSEVLPLYKATHVRIISAYRDEVRLVDPLTFGFYSDPLPSIPLSRQAEQLERVLQGEESQELHRERDHVIFNAALRLLWYDKVGTYEEGFQLAASLLQRQEPWKQLLRWRDLSQELDRTELPPRNHSAGL